MNIDKIPEDGRKVTFTDMQGIEHKGVYRKEKNGFEETSETELPLESQYVVPEDDVRDWEYRDSE